MERKTRTSLRNLFRKNTCNKVYLIIVFLLLLFFPPPSYSLQQFDPGLESIKSNDLMTIVKLLSSKEFDGRLSGSEGYNKAANFVAEKFKQLKLKEAGENGYYDYLSVEYNKIDTPAVFNLINENGIQPYKPGKDYVFRGFTGSADLTLPVAFCGYGISRPDMGFDEYENINVKDKIVIVFKQNPKWKMNDFGWDNNSPREKSRVAFEHGAKGILFVSSQNDKCSQVLIGSVAHGDGEQIEDFPQLHISPKAANDFISTSAYSIEKCQERIDKKQKPFSFLTRTKLK